MMEVKRAGEGVHGDKRSPLDTPGEVAEEMVEKVRISCQERG